MADKGFDEWALVELMGHQRIAGRVTEAEIGGCKFVRVDVPESDGRQPLTKFLGPASIYAITPMTEETAREVAGRIDSSPISAWDARRLVEIEDKRKSLPSTVGNDIDPDDEDDDRPF
jgi:hypothetical protein